MLLLGLLSCGGSSLRNSFVSFSRLFWGTFSGFAATILARSTKCSGCTGLLPKSCHQSESSTSNSSLPSADNKIYWRLIETLSPSLFSSGFLSSILFHFLFLSIYPSLSLSSSLSFSIFLFLSFYYYVSVAVFSAVFSPWCCDYFAFSDLLCGFYRLGFIDFRILLLLCTSSLVWILFGPHWRSVDSIKLHQIPAVWFLIK